MKVHLLCFLSASLQQGSLQIYLKSRNGPIEVYLCPEEGLEDVSPVKRDVTPKKENMEIPVTTPLTQSNQSVKEEADEGRSGFLWMHFF